MEKSSDKPSRIKLSRKTQVEVFRRDHWLCRWCKKPVIFAPAMKYLQLELENAGFSSKDLAYWRLTYDRRHAPLLDELAAVVDHVKALSAGGRGDLNNLATACNRCNMRKSNSDSEEWERKHPVRPIKSRFGEPENWDGFSTLFVVLARRHPASVIPTEKEWLEALEVATSAAQL